MDFVNILCLENKGIRVGLDGVASATKGAWENKVQFDIQTVTNISLTAMAKDATPSYVGETGCHVSATEVVLLGKLGENEVWIMIFLKSYCVVLKKVYRLILNTEINLHIFLNPV